MIVCKHTIVPANNAVLNSPVPDWDYSNPPEDLQLLGQEMLKVMRSKNGIGLAANQLGLPYRVFIMHGEPPFICVNPRVVDDVSEQVLMEEACLSFPGLIMKVKRPKSIKVRFSMQDGQATTKVFTGMTARVFLHELDHLNGLTFLQRANSIHREHALKKQKIFMKRMGGSIG